MVRRPIKKAKQKSKTDKTAKVKLTADEYVTGSGAPAPPSRTLEETLGVQIRNLRRQLDLTVADLAGAAQISVGMLSKIENGQISPSLGTLQSLAEALMFNYCSVLSPLKKSGRFPSFERTKVSLSTDVAQRLGIDTSCSDTPTAAI